MKVLLLLSLVAFLATSAYAWTKEDHEIFDLVSSLEAAEGKGTTFYSWLDVSPTASTPEISRAYRKKSMQLHPDKNPGVKGTQERFARLGVIAAILRNPQDRERYDFFYKNGVPRWRGTGYYYSRFRPGLGTVFVFLAILTSGLQHLVQRMNYKRDLGRIEQIIREARLAAWGQKMIPLETRRKVRVSLGGPPRLGEDGNVVLGKSLEMVVEPNGEVFIYEPDGGLTPVNTSTATPPAFTRTWAIALLHSLLRTVVKPKPTKETSASGPETETDDGSEFSEQPESVDSSATEATGTSSNGIRVKNDRLAAVKAGGRRKTAVRKR